MADTAVDEISCCSVVNICHEHLYSDCKFGTNINYFSTPSAKKNLEIQKNQFSSSISNPGKEVNFFFSGFFGVYNFFVMS